MGLRSIYEGILNEGALNEGKLTHKVKRHMLRTMKPADQKSSVQRILDGLLNAYERFFEVVGVILHWTVVMAMLAAFVLVPGGKFLEEGSECAQAKTIAQVGGCNALGNCTVQYIDGSVGRSSSAVRGHRECVKYGNWLGDLLHNKFFSE
jgi:hypothetical protein